MRRLFVLVFLPLTLQVTCAEVQPRDLIDEAWKLLDQLRFFVKGDILAAHDELITLGTDFATYTNNVVSEGALSIQQQHGSIIAEINTLKELANGAGKDVTTCTDTSEELLNRLPSEYTNTLMNCGDALVSESATLLRDARYIIDININRVYNFQGQINRCGNNIVCLTPIITEMQLDMVRLPAQIKTEVAAVESQLSVVKLSVDRCSDSGVTSYVSAANSMLADITACINRILDRP